MNTTQHVDYDALNALKDVMEGEFGFLIDTFIQDSMDRIEKLHSLVGGENVDAIRRASHSFKGSCSNLGALHLADLCASVERKALEHNFVGLAQDLQEIEQEFAIVKQKMFAFIGNK
jgi:HPt (histidine-containing phosphotransfer) domain-containing protein